MSVLVKAGEGAKIAYHIDYDVVIWTSQFPYFPFTISHIEISADFVFFNKYDAQASPMRLVEPEFVRQNGPTFDRRNDLTDKIKLRYIDRSTIEIGIDNGYVWGRIVDS